jgi:hypothetical protein
MRHPIGLRFDDMANGKPGDHPLNDVLDHHRQVFSPGVDELIVDLDRFGVWDGELVSFLMLAFHDEVERLRQHGGQDSVVTLLHNFEFVLRDERDRYSTT